MDDLGLAWDLDLDLDLGTIAHCTRAGLFFYHNNHRGTHFNVWCTTDPERLFPTQSTVILSLPCFDPRKSRLGEKMLFIAGLSVPDKARMIMDL